MMTRMSIRGTILFTVMAVGLAALIAWGMFTRTGVPGAFMRWQMANLGFCSLKLTFLLLFVSSSFVSLLLCMIFDSVTGLGSKDGKGNSR